MMIKGVLFKSKMDDSLPVVDIPCRVLFDMIGRKSMPLAFFHQERNNQGASFGGGHNLNGCNH